MIVAVTVIILRPQRIVLSNAVTGEKYAEYKLPDDGTFSVTFIHSVNKTPVSDIYEVRDGDIYLTGTVYYDFGAGVPTEVRESESLTYGPDGEMIISNMDTMIPRLIYVVGTVSDHVLEIDGTEVSLRDMCGRNSKVLFTVK